MLAERTERKTQTYTKNHRNFNLVQKDATGKFDLVSNVATYTLTDTAYNGTIILSIHTDPKGGKDNISSRPWQTNKTPDGLELQRDRTPVKMEGGRIQFKDPSRSFSQVFEGTKMTATNDGITEVWEKVQ